MPLAKTFQKERAPIICVWGLAESARARSQQSCEYSPRKPTNSCFSTTYSGRILCQPPQKEKGQSIVARAGYQTPVSRVSPFWERPPERKTSTKLMPNRQLYQQSSPLRLARSITQINGSALVALPATQLSRIIGFYHAFSVRPS